MRIFLDANILFSAARADGAVRQLLALCEDRGHELWADAYVLEEARRNLAYTNLPVSTIAYTLGFEDPAYFSRVYAAATGRSPSAFRTQLHGGEE